jgi:predicted branched-subunit amino acid permease
LTSIPPVPEQTAKQAAGEAAAERRKVIRNSLGVGVAVGAYGVAFGAASVAAGFSPAQTSVSSLLTFTGGSQFAIAGVVAGGGTAAAALGSGFLLGVRNTLYAVRMSELLGVRGWRRLVAALLTIDESTAMALGQRSPALARTAFFWTGGCVFGLWNLSTLAGAVGASALGDPRRFGLDAAIPAAFLALLMTQLRAPTSMNSSQLGRRAANAVANDYDGGRIAVRRRIGRSVAIALLAALIALVLIPLTPPGVPVLAAGFALALLAANPRRSSSSPTLRGGASGPRSSDTYRPADGGGLGPGIR